jgi:hypothetical protein
VPASDDGIFLTSFHRIAIAVGAAIRLSSAIRKQHAVRIRALNIARRYGALSLPAHRGSFELKQSPASPLQTAPAAANPRNHYNDATFVFDAKLRNSLF